MKPQERSIDELHDLFAAERCDCGLLVMLARWMYRAHRFTLNVFRRMR